MDTTGDPWDGRTLEWATASPPPAYNFAVIPEVHDRDAFWDMKQRGLTKPQKYEDIRMPKNTGMGVYISAFCFIVGFAFVWHINWLAVLGIIGAIACTIIRSLQGENEYTITAEELEKMEAKRYRTV